VSGRSDRGWDGLTDFRLQYERTIHRSAVELPPFARLLALALKSRSDEDGRCFPTIETLASDTGMGERTVDKYLAVLRDSGYLRSHRRRGASLYWLVIPPCASETHEERFRDARGAPLETHEVRTEVVTEDFTEAFTEGVTLVAASGTDEQEHRRQRQRENYSDEVRQAVARSLSDIARGWVA
jgi:GntR family transcriptional regulator